jgi:hypothetical protein
MRVAASGVTVHRTPVVLSPGGARVLGRPHVPGDEPGSTEQPRLERIVEGVLRLPADELDAELSDVRQRFAARHRDLELMLTRNAGAGRPPARRLHRRAAQPRRRLPDAGARLRVGGADEPVDGAGARPERAARRTLRFLLSLRAIGEGHISSSPSAPARSGRTARSTSTTSGPLVETGERREAVHERRHFAHKLLELGADPGCTARVLDLLPRHFGNAQLEQALTALDDLPRAVVHESDKLMRWLARPTTCSSSTPPAPRWPSA